MGDIADMHVEAFEAGLDPAEMDGADWADFYDKDDGPLCDTDAEAARMFGSEMWSWMLNGILSSRATDGESLPSVMARVFPELKAEQIKTFIEVCEAIPHDYD